MVFLGVYMTNYRLNAILPRSLSVRAWVAVCVIVFFAMATACTSALLAWVSKSDAQALNSVGSIRMATYRINYLITTKTSLPIDDNLELRPDISINQQLVDDMETRLEVLNTYQSMPGNKDTAIDNLTQAMQQQWYHVLKPAVMSDDAAAIHQASKIYINLANELTKSIQIRSENRQQWQQVLQISALVLIFLTLLVGMYELKHNVLSPIRLLIHSTRQFRSGHYVPAPLLGYREFELLSKSFNDMAHTISTHQAKLNQEVLNKTQHLTQANQLLTLLFQFSNQLNQEPITLSKLHHLLENFSKINPNFGFTLCLHGHSKQEHSDEYMDGSSHADNVNITSIKDSVSVHSALLEEIGEFENRVVSDKSSGKNITITPPSPAGKICTTGDCDRCQLKMQPSTKIYPIDAQNIRWGELIVHEYSSNHPSPANATELVQALANLIGLAFTVQKQRQQEHQIILLEERNTIARELHDSIAQSLSFLKIQLAMLGTHAKQLSEAAQNSGIENQYLIQCNDNLLQVLAQARTGLDRAYTQLRELLVTFRLQIDSDSFDSAIEQACTEFATKGDFKINLDNRILSQNLSANEQIDLLQIAREALSNIQRHADAKLVNITLYQHLDDEVGQRIHMQISDDGVGLPKHFDTQQHHGLKIMQERARNLGGKFQIKGNTPHGTVVQVSFLPKFYKQFNN